jgi:hypothetical protein
MADDIKSTAAELMKKVLTIGVGAIFLTEESLRGLTGDFKVPKELLGGILDSAQKTKKDFLQSLSQDVMSRISDKVDPRALLEEFFQRNEIELSMKIRFKPLVKSDTSGDSTPES